MRAVWIISFLLIAFGIVGEITRSRPDGPAEQINSLITADPFFTTPDPVFVPRGDIATSGRFDIREGHGSLNDREGDIPFATFDATAPHTVAPFAEFEVSAEIGPFLADAQPSSERSGGETRSTSIPRMDQMRVELQGAGLKIVSRSRDWLSINDGAAARWVWIVSTDYTGNIHLNFLIEGRTQLSTGMRIEQVGFQTASLWSENGWYSTVGAWLGPLVDFALLKVGKYSDGLAFWTIAFGFIGTCYAFWKTKIAKPRAAKDQRAPGYTPWYARFRRKPNAAAIAAASLIEPPQTDNK